MIELRSNFTYKGLLPQAFFITCDRENIIIKIGGGLPEFFIEKPLQEIFNGLANLPESINANVPCCPVKISMNAGEGPVKNYNGILKGDFGKEGNLLGYEISATLIKEKEINTIAKKLLNVLVDNAQDFIAIYSLKDNKLLFANNSIFQYLGYQFPNEKSLWHYADTFVHPDDLPKINTILKELRERSEEKWETTFRAYHMSGEMKWFQINVALIEKEHLQANHFICIIKEVTEVKNQEVYTQSEAFIHKILQRHVNAEVFILSADKEVQAHIVKHERSVLDEGVYAKEYLIGSEVPYEVIEIVLIGLEKAVNGDFFNETLLLQVEKYTINIAPIISFGNIENIVLVLTIEEDYQHNKHVDSLNKNFDQAKKDLFQLKHQNDVLKEQIERLRISLDVQRSFFIKYNVEGEIIYVNKTFSDFLKARPNEIISGHKKPEIVIDDLLKFNSAMSELRAFPHKSVKIDYRIIVDGKIYFTNWELYSLADTRKNVNEFIASGMDITQQMSHQGRIQESEERFRLISNATNEAIWDWNILTNVSWWNITMYEFLGFSQKTEADINTFLKAVHPEDREMIQNKINDALSTKKTHWSGEFRAWVRDKQIYRYFYNRAYLNYNQDNIPERMLGSLMDITERKNTELRFKALNERFQLAVKAGKTGIWQYVIGEDSFVFDHNLITLYVSEGKSTDYISSMSLNQEDSIFFKEDNHSEENNQKETASTEPLEELLGKKIFNSFRKALLNYLQKADFTQPFEFIQRRTKNKKNRIWILSRATIVLDEDGNPLHFVGTDTDITAQKNAEEKMRLAKQETDDAMRTQENFFSLISHEIRSPLTGIIGMNDVLLKQLPRSDQEPYLEAMKFSADNLLVLINDLLDFSKIRAGKLEFEENDFDLHLLLKNTYLNYKTQTKDKNIAFEMIKGKALPKFIKGDRTRLSQILNNLLSNAIKFTSEGSVTLNIEIENETDSDVSLYFKVTDTGIGIPLNKQQKIFKPFEQASKDTSRKYGGTGLGLSIVKNLVELQGGTLNFESTQGEGTIFKILLHYKKETNNKDENGIASIDKDLSHIRDFAGLNVLYIDDVPTNQLVMKGFATRWGIALDAASDGYEGLHKIQRGVYELVLMDLQMPGIDGYETTRRIRAFADNYYKKIPVIALTADVSNLKMETINEAGLTDYLAKPINFDKLYNLLKKHQITPKTKEKIALKQPVITNLPANLSITLETEIDFTGPDLLFIQDVDGYSEFLDKSIIEIKINRKKLVDAVLEHDINIFSKAHHKVAGMLKFLKLDEVEIYLSEVKESLNTQNKFGKEKQLEVVNKIDRYFSNTLNGFKEKINGIKKMVK